jgi:putative salt-induced outer membrane protein YdiY
MKKHIATIIATAGVMAVFADTSTNTGATGVVPEKKSPWQSNASLGLTITRGNSNTSLLAAKVLTDRKDSYNEWLFGADGTYGENGGTESADSVHGFGQWNHLFSEKLFGYLRVDGLHDRIADIKYRVTIGPGVGYYFLKETNTTLSAEAGGAEVFEELGSAHNSFATLRLAEKFEHKFNEHGARVWQSFEILPQVDNFNNYIINAEIGVEAAIARNLSLQSYIDDSFDNEPAAGHLKNDVKLVTGIDYKF